VTQGAWNGVHVFLIVHDELAHEAMSLFDSALGEVPGKAEVLAARTARDTVLMRAGPAHHRNDEIAALHSADGRPDVDDLAEAFMANGEVVGSRGRRAVLESRDLLVGAAYAYVQHFEHDVRGRHKLRLFLLDQTDFAPRWNHGHRFHCVSPSRFKTGCSTIVLCGLSQFLSKIFTHPTKNRSRHIIAGQRAGNAIDFVVAVEKRCTIRANAPMSVEYSSRIRIQIVVSGISHQTGERFAVHRPSLLQPLDAGLLRKDAGNARLCGRRQRHRGPFGLDAYPGERTEDPSGVAPIAPLDAGHGKHGEP